MSAPWHDWTPPGASPDFAARVAHAARREFVARRARRRLTVAAVGSALALAAAVALFVRVDQRGAGPARSVARASDEARIEPDEPRVLPGSIAWPLTKGWDDKIFTFPLPFAPSLPYKGVVPLHFAPTFAEAGADGYWSLVVVWVKADVPANDPPDPRQLERDLRDYYTGLCRTGGHPDTHTTSPGFADHEARLSPAPVDPSDRRAGGEWSFHGELQTVDCIVTGGEITLDVEAVAGACDGRISFTAYALSPRPLSDPIWPKLRAERRAFDCRHPATAETITALTTVPPGAAVPIPDTPAGRALAWVVAALSHPPTEAEVTERLARSVLAAAPARKEAEALAQLGASYPEPLVARVSERSPTKLLVVLRSGDREAPILGRELTLAIAVDPEEPTRILSIDHVAPDDADAGVP